MMSITTKTHEDVKAYYGRVLQGSKDLKTDACCSIDQMPEHLRAILGQIDSEIVDRFYGCGSPIPPAVEGRTIVDLGCGTGRDTYVCSKLVGETGRVIGVDMTREQLEVAQRHVEAQTGRFGFARPNATFLLGYMEDLASLGIESESVDVVISNCVINLVPDKRPVFSEIFRVLKPGGELYFSDVFADRRLPDEWRNDPVLVGECLGGAMYIEDFRRMLLVLGVPDYRITAQRRITLANPEIEARVAPARFYSLTVRAFKVDSLEDRREDYGHLARYCGTIAHAPGSFKLDVDHEFESGRPTRVCGNTAAMLTETRFAEHFDIDGDRTRHFGLFRSMPRSLEAVAVEAAEEGTCGCC
jgi:arsenite methyltransferase